MKKIKIEKSLDGEVLCKIRENLYGILINNKIIIAYKTGFYSYTVNDSYTDLQGYLLSHLPNEGAILGDIIDEPFNIDLLENYISNSKYLQICKDTKLITSKNYQNERLLSEYVNKHLNETCNCNSENMELCLGGLYINGLMTKEEIFKDWD